MYSKDFSDNDYDCYLYTSQVGSEPAVIAVSKKKSDKDLPDPIFCARWLKVEPTFIECLELSSWDDCAILPNGRIQICNWSKFIY